MGKKYKTKKDPETGLLRIIALKDFSDVKKGDKGGLIQNEANLSQEGDCWIYDNARVYGYAKVYGNAQVFGDASVWGSAFVHDNAKIYGRAQVYGYANVYDNVSIGGEARIGGMIILSRHPCIQGKIKLWATMYSYIDTSIENNKDYVMLVISDRRIVVVAKDITESQISLPTQTEDITAFTITALDYLKNIKIIRQLYGKEV